MFAGEKLRAGGGGQEVVWEFTAGWRFLVWAGAVLIWVAGMGEFGDERDVGGGAVAGARGGGGVWYFFWWRG